MDFLANLPILFSDPQVWIALITLVVMEVVLGIDNLIFISVLTNKLPPAQRPFARRLGIGLAVVLRLALLGSIAWIANLTQPAFEVFGHTFTWRDLVMLGGGLFLVWKATMEIHHKVDPNPVGDVFDDRKVETTMAGAIVQILILDVVFSLDSVITAVGMVQHIEIMVIAVLISVVVMLLAATPLADFLDRNPTVVMLALGFLLMIGTTLIADGFGFHVPKGYIYAAMAFSAFVEILNIMARNAKLKRTPAAGDTGGL